MIKVYYSSNADAIYWKIFVDNPQKVISYFPTKATHSEVADRLCQTGLFDSEDENKVYVIRIDGWKLADKETKASIKALHECEKNIVFAYETASIKNKVFSELKIEATKATSITKRSKASVITQLVKDAGIKLDLPVIDILVAQLPDNIDFIKNEILKLKLVGQPTFSAEEIQKIIFDLGDATVFNIVDSWLNGNEEQTIERLNDLISKNVTIQAFIPIFGLKLMQIKLFLTAKLAKWSSELITAKMGLPFWQQNMYSNLRPYDKNLSSIDTMLKKLYDFDINVKKQKNIPYSQLIKILFK